MIANYSEAWAGLFYFKLHDVSPLPPINDLERISPYNINTISSIEEMRIK